MLRPDRTPVERFVFEPRVSSSPWDKEGGVWELLRMSSDHRRHDHLPQACLLLHACTHFATSPAHLPQAVCAPTPAPPRCSSHPRHTLAAVTPQRQTLRRWRHSCGGYCSGCSTPTRTCGSCRPAAALRWWPTPAAGAAAAQAACRRTRGWRSSQHQDIWSWNRWAHVHACVCACVLVDSWVGGWVNLLVGGWPWESSMQVPDE